MVLGAFVARIIRDRKRVVFLDKDQAGKRAVVTGYYRIFLLIFFAFIVIMTISIVSNPSGYCC
jgi:hypothetical protein